MLKCGFSDQNSTNSLSASCSNSVNLDEIDSLQDYRGSSKCDHRAEEERGIKLKNARRFGGY